jgi:RND family efflux transporter MFP subunit
MNRCRRWTSLLIVALLAAPGVVQAAGPSVLVKTAPARETTLTDRLTAFGHVQADPDSRTSINLPHAGLVNRLWIRLGQRVGAGAPLLQLDTAPTTRMRFQQAKAGVDYARSERQRMRRLFDERLATRTQVASAERRLRDARAALAAQRKLGAGQGIEVIRAPFAGIVTQLNVNQGERVQADTNALILARRDRLLVPLGVEPEDARRLKPGMAVTLSPVFDPRVRIHATLATIHAMINPRTRLVDVIARVDPKDTHDLMLDMVMEGTIVVSRTRALAVPRSAILTNAKGGYLFVVRGNTAHRVDVRTGVEDHALVAITGPVRPGDRVVVLGNYELHNGATVRENP